MGIQKRCHCYSQYDAKRLKVSEWLVEVIQELQKKQA